MANPIPKTITYSENLQGWTSFHSFNPDWMAGMNNDFYTFKNGKVWKHHSNSTRNSYYGTTYDSTIRTIFNVEADSPKMFKTLKLKGKSDLPWSATILSDLNDGQIEETDYEKKEGNWYSYIRRNENNIDPTYLSVQGVGKYLEAIIGTGFITIVVNGNLLNYVNQKTDGEESGDLLYKYDSSNNKVLIGQVDFLVYDSVNNNTIITYVASGGTLLLPTDQEFIFAVKNSQAESFGLRGAYMDVTLTNSETDEVELLTVASEVFKSYQ